MPDQSQSLSHIDTSLLQCYMQQRASAEDATAIGSHLDECESCASRYASLLLKGTVRRLSAPDQIWRGIEARLLPGPARRSGGLMNGRVNGMHVVIGSAVALALLIAALIVPFHYRIWTRFWTKPAIVLNLEAYLETVEQNAGSSSASNLRAQLPGFKECDRDTALLKTGLTGQLDRYSLVDQQILHDGADDAVQLLYESGTDAFALFVVPSNSVLRFGHYTMLNTEVSGFRCSRAECPRQDIYLLKSGVRNYIFVRRHIPAPQADQLVAELVRAIP